MEPALGARLPFAEQLAFFREKLRHLVPTERWADLMKAGHDRGFAVAGAMKADLLADLGAAVGQVLAEGKSIDWFRTNFDQVVEKHGWAYQGERAWRTRVVYRTNVATSTAAGRLAQLRSPELLKLKPYWMYVHADSVLHPRPLHLAWNGLTLPADHPWWLAHYPPNGWGCHCRVVAVTAEEARRRGGRLEEPTDDGVDPKTGVPNGIDYGWDYMPGNTRSEDVARAVAGKLADWPAEIRAAFEADERLRKLLEAA